jgi:hypothetical protein
MMIQQPPSVTASPGMMYPQSAMSNPYTTVTASPVTIQQPPSVIASPGMRYQQQPMMIQQQPMMIMQPVMALQPSVVTVPYQPPRQEIITVERPREVMTYIERPSVTSEYSNVKYGGRYAYKQEDRDRVITPQYRSRSPTRTPVTDSKPVLALVSVCFLCSFMASPSSSWCLLIIHNTLNFWLLHFLTSVTTTFICLLSMAERRMGPFGNRQVRRGSCPASI